MAASGSSDDRAPFPVVGVGASAGGLEAFTQFLSGLPERTGMGFVLVQHLDPRHESALPGLLQRKTSLTVVQGEDGAEVRRDHAYVIPPNVDMTIERGHLRVTPRQGTRGPHLPIDRLFRSLAEEQQSHAIGIVLSGTGSDGTVGVSEIKAVGGITFAQDETSATHPGMPHSAVESGNVDFVLPPDEIARRLGQISEHPYLREDPDKVVELAPEEAFRQILKALRSVTGVDFTHYRDTTIRRRILRRMALHRHESIQPYAAMVAANREEAEALYHDLLINVTSFFRDPELFEELKRSVFPRIVEAKPASAPIRIWVPGCSTGQESYSLAMTLCEFFDDRGPKPEIQIFATDLSDTPALEKARVGIYPEGIEVEVPPERLRRFFRKDGHAYRIEKSIRDMCVFARHNLIADPPFSHVDLVSCRNVLIYMGSPLQKRVIPIFHYALEEPGFLVLGTSETVGEFTELFEQLDRAHKIYSKKIPAGRPRVHFSPEDFGAPRLPASPKPGAPSLAATEFHREVDRLLFDRYAPAGVLVGDRFEVLQFRGRTAPYLEAPPGEPTSDVLKLAREGLFLDLRGALTDAKKSGKRVRREGVRIAGPEGLREIDVLVEPVKLAASAQTCFLVLFEERPTADDGDRGHAESSLEARPRSSIGSWFRGARPKAAPDPSSEDAVSSANGQLDRLRRELESMKEYMQSLVEQRDAVNEELRSANEEILSSNEELQSTNEELETAKEELQSANEELVTVNEQLQHRNVELNEFSNDLTNLLASMTIPVVMVGNDRRIRFVTPATKRVWNVLPSDIGRPLTHIKPNVELPDLDEMILKAMETVQIQETEVQDREGTWFLLRVHPYRTTNHRVDGAVLVLLDIDQAKQVEKLLREKEAYFRELMQSMPHVVWTNLPDGKMDFINRRWEEYTGQVAAPAGTLPEAWAKAIHPDDRGAADGIYADSVGKAEEFGFDARLRRGSDGAYRWHLIRAVPLVDARQSVFKFIGTCTDIEDMKKAEQALLRADRRKDEFLATLSHELRNPLGAIRNAVQLMMEAADDSKTTAVAREIVERQTEQMILLVDDMLDLSRIVEGKISLKREVCELTPIVRSAIETTRGMMEKREHEVQVSLPPEPVYVDADPMRMSQVIVNLLTNAGKFTPSGNGKISIEASVREECPVDGEQDEEPPRGTALRGRQAVIRVRDNGIGIDPEFAPHVFEMFIQADQAPARATGGLGVGLTLAKSLVQMHGGTIELASEGVGKGSEFTVCLPIVVPMSETKGSKAERKAGPAGKPRPRRILLIDDNLDHAESLRRLLQNDGHEVRVAMDGAVGLGLAREFEPEVALVDIGMPGLTGYDVAREMRKAPGLAKTVLAALTGYGRESDRHRVQRAGFQHHFVKPVDFDELRKWLEPAEKK